MGRRRYQLARLLVVVLLTSTLGLAAASESAAAAKKKVTFTMANYAELSNSPNSSRVPMSTYPGRCSPSRRRGRRGPQPCKCGWIRKIATGTPSSSTRPRVSSPRTATTYTLSARFVGSTSTRPHWERATWAVLIAATSVKETNEAATEPPIGSTGTTMTSCVIDSFDSSLVDITGSIRRTRLRSHTTTTSPSKCCRRALGWEPPRLPKMMSPRINRRLGPPRPTLRAATGASAVSY